MEKIYTVKEVAVYLGLKPETVRVMLRDGRIKGIKVSRDWRVTESALKAFVAGGGDDE